MNFGTLTSRLAIAALLALAATASADDWKNQITFADEPFASDPVTAGDPTWVKFTIKLDEPDTVYFQDSARYVLHHEFATSILEPFIGLTSAEYYQITLYSQNQQAALGTVLLPPTTNTFPPEPRFLEYGIQFVRQDPYTREQIAAMFETVKANVIAEPNVTAFYLPTHEQSDVALANIDWFADQNIPVSSTARWASGNACYSKGWALGRLLFVEADQIAAAYQRGLLKPTDILLTDAVPAEIPYVAGVISLSPSTPSSHVAILSQTYSVPFVYLAVPTDANNARALAGSNVALTAYTDELGACDIQLLDVNDTLTLAQIDEILQLKAPAALDISPIVHCGSYSADTTGLTPADINCFGGKASNFGILRTSIPDNSPTALALSFDLWNEFLGQPINPRPAVIINPGDHLLIWADNDPEQGPTHTNFALRAAGEYIGLYAPDGITAVDSIYFGQQTADVSFGRIADGTMSWTAFGSGSATPGAPNADISIEAEGLFINEFMADNETTIADPDGSGGHPDWIEIYNAGPDPVDLGGYYLTDDANEPTKWMVSYGITADTLRGEIDHRLSSYRSYPPTDPAAVASDLAAIRMMFTDTTVTDFTPLQIITVESALLDPKYGFDTNSNIRLRSSTNVEDSDQFTGAGLYDSYSGCLADEFDSDDAGPSLCDPNENGERGIFRAIRRVYASFYNNNAFLERLRHSVDESSVGMAVLVHHSFTDEIELANGVATVDKRGSGSNMYITLVTQHAAISVTNPDPSSIPEEVTMRVFSSGRLGSPRLLRQSNQIPLGATVMDWQDDYIRLTELLAGVTERYAVVTGKSEFVLDLEYKKMAPGGAALPEGGLIVKQVRPIPQPGEVASITPFLINQPTQYTLFSGEYRFNEPTDIFAAHRCKSRWTLRTRSTWLDETALQQSIYATVDIEYVQDHRITSTSAPLSMMPAADHSFEAPVSADTWRMGPVENARTLTLSTENIPALLTPAENPLLTIRSLGSQPFMLTESRFKVLPLKVDYPAPVRAWAGDNCSPVATAATISSRLYLWPAPPVTDDDILELRTFIDNGIKIDTELYRPPPPAPDGTWEMSTAPLARFVRTTIEGLTSSPVVLTGYYSQTYQAGHHNIIEHFLFEPALDPNVPRLLLYQLAKRDMDLIHVRHDTGTDTTTINTHSRSFHPGDLNGDLLINYADFAGIAGTWNAENCCACNGADLTGDGKVNFQDLLHLTENWLQ